MNPVKDGLRKVLGSRVPAAFVAGAVGLALVGEWVIKSVEPFGIIWLLIAGLVFLGISVLLVRGWFRRDSHGHMTCVTGAIARPARVLFVTSSGRPEPGPAGIAIEHFRAVGQLERVYVLHTDDERGHRSFKALRAWAEERVPPRTIHPITLPAHATDDPKDTYDAIEAEYEELDSLGFEADEIVLDYTGGTKAFAAAMTLAGAQGQRRLSYVAPEGRDTAGRRDPTAGYKVIEVDLVFRVAADSPRTSIRLEGEPKP